MLLYAVSCIFDAFVIYLLFESFFEKRRKNASVIFFASGLVLQQVITTIITNCTEVPNLRLLIQVVGVFLLTFFYTGTFLKHVLGMVIYVGFSIIAEGVAVVSASLMGLDSSEEEEIVLLFLVEIFLLVLVLFTKLFEKKEGKLPKRYQLGFIVVPALSLVIINGMANNRPTVSWLVGLVSLLIINMVSYYLLNTLTGYIMEQSKKSQMEQQVEIQKEKYEQLSASLIKGNRLIHDINKHHRILKEYLMEGNATEASMYIDKIDKSFEQVYSSINTGNLIIDAIMGRYKDILEQKGCQSEIRINIDKNKTIMKDYDLVIVLGNITDNIIEALNDVSPEEKCMAEIELKMTETMFIIYSKNSIATKMKLKKKDKWFHGLGLRNVKDTIEKYGGSMVACPRDDYFETMIQVPLKGGEVQLEACI